MLKIRDCTLENSLGLKYDCKLMDSVSFDVHIIEVRLKYDLI